ncbi:MAG: hypothetical protein JNM17_32740 [Archangium sp.]|nr:hypothetical protein [Archangium sp.]
MKRWVGGLLALAALAYGGYWVASFSLPMDKVPFDTFSTGIGPRIWRTWGYLGVFVLAAVAFGQFVVRRLSKTSRDGAWALAFSTGTISFAALIGLFGWVGVLGYPFFWVLPLTMTLIGVAPLRDALVETTERWKKSPPLSALEIAAFLFGGLCLGLLVMQAVVPDNINFDATWYHLRAGERNAIAGAITRTPEGDLLLTLPSATGWLYTWAFLAPLSLEDKVMLSLHLELAVFIGTMACIPPLVRALVPGIDRTKSRATWVALFFFPAVFIYDTGIMAGGDHIVGLWTVSSVLAWLQAREHDDAPSWALVGIQLAGLTAKYTSIYLLVPLIPMMGIDALWRGRAVPFAKRVSGLMTGAAVTLAVTAPYWLRNLVWYHNPIYPSGSSIFPSTPWHEDANVWISSFARDNTFAAAISSPSHRVSASIDALKNYHQTIYGWADMQGGHSVMGSGYFLSMLALPFIAHRRRLLALALILNVGVVVWFNTYQHHMRYLLVLAPLMAAGMAATAVALWELSWPGRVAVVGVTALLLTAYADVPFRRTHRMNRGSSPVENFGEFLKQRGVSGHLKGWAQLGDQLPPNAKPLVHGMEPPFGLGRLTVTDAQALQFGINYGRLGSTEKIWQHLRTLGVTHLIWNGGWVIQGDSVTGEALFVALAHSTINRRVGNGLNVGELPPTAPPQPGTHLLYLGCSGRMWRTGVYPLETLVEPLPPMWDPWPELQPYEPVDQANAQVVAVDPRVGWVVMEEACTMTPPPGYTLMSSQASTAPFKLKHFVRDR